jgi:hypothetical protein
MPMGIVSDDEFEAELKNSSVDTNHQDNTQVITGEVVDSPAKGRGNGNVAVPDSLRKIIGETSELEGRQSAIAFAQSLGLSASSVSAYSAGATSTATYDKPSPTISKHISERKSSVANKAISNLRKSLSILTPEKIQTGTAREVAAIAKDMAAIVKMMEPEDNGNGNESVRAPQFVVYAPQFKNENHFETIVAKDDF